jgi:hypothetical protein
MILQLNKSVFLNLLEINLKETILMRGTIKRMFYGKAKIFKVL